MVAGSTRTYGKVPAPKKCRSVLLDVIAFGNLFGKILFPDLFMKIHYGLLVRR
jgi:hypothetical protein